MGSDVTLIDENNRFALHRHGVMRTCLTKYRPVPSARISSSIAGVAQVERRCCHIVGSVMYRPATPVNFSMMKHPEGVRKLHCITTPRNERGTNGSAVAHLGDLEGHLTGELWHSGERQVKMVRTSIHEGL